MKWQYFVKRYDGLCMIGSDVVAEDDCIVLQGVVVIASVTLIGDGFHISFSYPMSFFFVYFALDLFFSFG